MGGTSLPNRSFITLETAIAMVEVNIIRKRQKRLYVPESWEELDGRQLVLACEYRALQAGDPEKMLSVARRIIGADRRTWRSIPPAQKCLLCEELLSFIINDTPAFRDNKIPSFRVGLRRLHGFDDMLSDITWEEFIYADTFILKGMHREAIAVLYRPAGILGRKKKFSDKLLERNSERTEKLGTATVAALVTNYMAVRRKALEEKNRHLFPHTEETYFDGKLVKPEGPQAPNQTTGWADTHHILMGDLAYEERKFLDSKATTIVAWINRRIKESRDRERERRKK